MKNRFQQRELIRLRLQREVGTLHKRQGLKVALVYPSPYRVGMSSLGFQTIYRIINTETSHTAERAFLPDGEWSGPLLTYESMTPVGNMDIVAFSLAYELEAPGLIECLLQAGLDPLAENRRSTDPIVIIGGPITYSNPRPFSPFADLMILGEADSAIGDVLDRIGAQPQRPQWMDNLADIPGVYIPRIHQVRVPPIAKADDDRLPAYSQIVTPDSEFAGMHLVEAERGCHRQCTFCVMRHSTNHGMRLVQPNQILNTIPDHATRVGLVGSAVSDHPQLPNIVAEIIGSGREVSLSSLRADRITPELLKLLKKGGYRTLTIAADGASERLRNQLKKGIRAQHLLTAAELAHAHEITKLKVYVMLGVPNETEADIDELADLLEQLGRIMSVVVAISPFVPKANTPLVRANYGGVKRIGRRVKRLRQRLGNLVEIRSTSARWGWVEYAMAQGTEKMAQVALSAYDQGNHFKAWKDAIAKHAPKFMKYTKC